MVKKKISFVGDNRFLLIRFLVTISFGEKAFGETSFFVRKKAQQQKSVGIFFLLLKKIIQKKCCETNLRTKISFIKKKLGKLLVGNFFTLFMVKNKIVSLLSLMSHLSLPSLRSLLSLGVGKTSFLKTRRFEASFW